MTGLRMRSPASSARGLVATATRHAPIDPIALFGAARAAGSDAFLWHDPSAGRSVVGVDVAVCLEPHGRDRFLALAREWEALVGSIEVTGDAAGSTLAGPLLLGGGTFRDHASLDPRWADLPVTRFIVPRRTLVIEGDHAVLTTVGSEDDPAPVIPSGILDGRAGTADALPGFVVSGGTPDRAAWGASVARITGAVGRGRLDKVVLARRVDLVADRPVDPVATLRRLTMHERADPTPGIRLPSTVFAVGHGRTTFLGSSPERVASVRGRTLRTMALAGTAPRGRDAADDAALGALLLASEKDREEHAVVVGMLRRTLTPLVEELAVGRTPSIVRSNRVQHLMTDITGTLRADVRLLDVVRHVHPTPAVAGWPTDAALELLDEESTLDRGWYAGPVGWVDGAGDGDVAVAIRSALLTGREVSLFAGCGIVADSEPEHEWDESALKLRVMGDALGWDGA